MVEQQHSGVIGVLDEACFLVGTVTDRVREGGREEGGREEGGRVYKREKRFMLGREGGREGGRGGLKKEGEREREGRKGESWTRRE